MKQCMKKLLTGLVCLCVCLSLCRAVPVRASADTEIDKVLVTTSYIPVALMDVSFITAATSTCGCSVTAYNWYDSSGNVAAGQFGTDNYEVQIQLTASDGYYFSDDVAVYLNNSQADYRLEDGNTVLTLYRTYAPELWAPSVIKNPGSETVDEGGCASFVATATYTRDYKWYIHDPSSGRTCSPDELPGCVEGVATSGDGASKMNIYNVPAEMDGWEVYCVFVGEGGETKSASAKIKVRFETPEPAATPGPLPSPVRSPQPGVSPGPGTQNGQHEHDFSGAWKFNDTLHWHECSCGQKSGEEQHSMEWTVEREATKKLAGTARGVCTVCGYETVRELQYEGSNAVKYIVLGIGAFAALTIIVLIVDSAVKNSRRRRRRRRRR